MRDIAIGGGAALAILLLLRQAAWMVYRARLGPSSHSSPVRRHRRLVAGAAIIAAAFVGLTALELGGALRGLDALIDQRLAPLRSATLVIVWQFITETGSNGAVAAVAVVATLLLSTGRRGGALPSLWLALLGALATVWGAKYALALPRPVFTTSTIAVSPTFPSAHATAAIALYGTLACLIGRALRPGLRFELGYWTVVLVVAIGFSRVFLGVHYASDVAAGYLVGGFWLLLALAFLPPQR